MDRPTLIKLIAARIYCAMGVPGGQDKYTAQRRTYSIKEALRLSLDADKLLAEGVISDDEDFFK